MRILGKCNRRLLNFQAELVDISYFQDFYRQVKPYASRIDIIPAKSGIAHHIGVEFKADSLSEYELLLKKAEENTHVVITLPLQND